MNKTKTNRKNKTGLTINWPKDTYFTIKYDLLPLNPEFVPITLRVRVKKALTDNVIVKIGEKMGGKGRPSLIFATTPVSHDVYEKAKADGILMVDEAKLITVMQVTKATPVATTPTEEEDPATVTQPEAIVAA